MNEEQVIEIHMAPNTHSTEILGIPLSQIAICFVAIFLIVYMSLLKKKKKPRNIIALVGERYSGKTQLFINLGGGKKMATVPSIRKNETSLKINEKIYELIDYNGDNLSKEEVINNIDSVHCIVHVIDGTNKKSFGDAAMFLYQVLVNKNFRRQNCNYVIFINKADEKGFVGKERFEALMQEEMQMIKTARIHQGEESQKEEDYIKLSKSRYKLGAPLKWMIGSAESNIKELELILQNL